MFEAFHLRVDHGPHMAPRNPLLEFQDIQRYIAIARWPRWDSKGIDGITVPWYNVRKNLCDGAKECTVKS